MKRLTPLIYCCALMLCALSCRKKDKSDAVPIREARLGDSIEVTIPEGTLTSTKVSLKAVNDNRIVEVFNETKDFYFVNDNIVPYQIVLNIGDQAPANDSILLKVRLSDFFKSLKPGNYGFEIFAQSYEEGGMETLDLFTIMTSKYNFETGQIEAYLPAGFFTNARTTDKSYEIILMIGTTPGENLRMSAFRKSTGDNAGAKCKASQIACPLGGGTDNCVNETTSDYGWREDPKKAFHRGIDYGIPVGTNVYAAADGVVELSKEGKGYGNIIFLRHKDKTATLYAHLSVQSVVVGATVKKGQLIGKSGGEKGAPGAGTSTGPHLHFEFYPTGGQYADKKETDPFPCISDGNIDGSITVRDNGNIADDAFEVFLDGISMGTTDIGASNSIAANNLRPGTKTMTLKCLIAPDNVGTYEVLLNDGLTFSPGAEVVQSGVIGEGESISWTIIIPNQQRKIDNSAKMRMNRVEERK